jgi:hypothetical protein
LGHCVADANDRNCVVRAKCVCYRRLARKVCSIESSTTLQLFFMMYHAPTPITTITPRDLILPYSPCRIIPVLIEVIPLINYLATSMRVYSFCCQLNACTYLQCQPNLLGSQPIHCCAISLTHRRLACGLLCWIDSAMQGLLFGCDLTLSVRQDAFAAADVGFV